MKRILLLFIVLSFVLASCSADTQKLQEMEQNQQARGVEAIVSNQPIPDLGGFSFERQVVIETYHARNNTVATYAYMFTMDGKIVEICASIGYPIPYSTQLSSPDKIVYATNGNVTTNNIEANGLYPPGDAAATLVQCVNTDGSVSPVYIEWYVLAFPYRIASDYQLVKIGEPSFRVEIQK